MARKAAKEEAKKGKRRLMKKKTKTEKEAKTQKVISKLIMISQMKKSKESAARYIKELPDKLIRHPFMSDRSSEIKHALFDITANKDLDADMHQLVADVEGRLSQLKRCHSE